MKKIGTETPLAEEERDRLITELNWWRDKARDFFDDRKEAERAFYCIWDGQDADGTVHGTDREEAFPFEGASDQRCRWGEEILEQLAALMLVAVGSCEVEFACGAGAEGEKRANALKRLLEWELANLGAKEYAEILALIRYFMVDTPCVAAMDVGWRRREDRAVETLSAERLQEEYAAAMEATGEASRMDAEFTVRRAFDGATGEDEGDEAARAVETLALWIAETYGADQDDAEKIIAALAEDGECEFLARRGATEGLELRALRYGEDFCFQREATDFENANPIFLDEWVSETQLRERQETDGWDEEWVEETLRHKGASFYNERSAATIDDMKDWCNIVWCYMAEPDGKGGTRRYVAVLSHAEGSAFGKRIVRSRRGKWNIAFFRREVKSRRLADGRGLAALCAPSQGIGKRLADGMADNAIVGSLPPVLAKGTRVRNVVLEPFAVVPMGVNDNVAFMQPPAYPASAKEIRKQVKDELLAYFGISNGETDVTERRQAFVNLMLRQFKELFALMVEVAQDGASDELLAGITRSGDVQGLRREEITGTFGITLKLDPRNLDWKQLMEKTQSFSQVLMGMDRERIVDTSPVVRHVMHQMWPEISLDALKTAEEVQGRDIEEEKRNFTLIKAGVMPQMDTSGRWNYGVRLQWWQQLQQENPDAIAEMSPASQEMMQRWLQALQQQNTQYGENAQIGRTGVEGVEG